MSETSVYQSSARLHLLRTIAGWILCIPIAFVFVMAGLAKLTGRPGMVLEFEQIGLGQWFRYFTGILEAAGAIGLLIPRYSAVAALGLAVIMVGAIVAHFFALPGPATLPALLLGLLLILAWLRC